MNRLNKNEFESCAFTIYILSKQGNILRKNIVNVYTVIYSQTCTEKDQNFTEFIKVNSRVDLDKFMSVIFEGMVSLSNFSIKVQ